MQVKDEGEGAEPRKSDRKQNRGVSRCGAEQKAKALSCVPVPGWSARLGVWMSVHVYDVGGREQDGATAGDQQMKAGG